MLTFSSYSFSALQSKVGYASWKQKKEKICSYTRHLHVSSLNCDSWCFHLLKHRNSGWSQPLKMTATGIDCATLSFAWEILSLCLPCFSLTFFFSGLLFCCYFKHCSFMNMGFILLWLLYYLSKKEKVCCGRTHGCSSGLQASLLCKNHVDSLVSVGQQL